MGVLDWLGFSRKESATGSLRAGYMQGQPVYRAKASENREKFAEESMKAVIAYASIRAISKAFASAKWYACRESSDGTQDPVDAPDLMNVWRNPQPLMSGSQFRELWATYYMIHGEGPVERVIVGGKPKELYALEPDRMGVVPGATGMPAAYDWKAPNGQVKRFPVDPVTGECDVRFIKAANPVEQWRGLAPTWVAGVSIDAYNAGREWNAGLLQNSARPSGILSTDGPLTDEQRERLRGRLEDMHGGPRNAGRPLVAEGGMTWQALSESAKDMEWLEGSRETARHIALAYGVPPMLLGIPGDNTYSNYREARLSFYDDTVIPLLKLFESEMNAWLVPSFGEGIRIKADIDAIEALDYRTERKVESLMKADWLSVDEKRAAMGYDALDAGGDVVPAVQQWSGFMLPEDDPETEGSKAYGGE